MDSTINYDLNLAQNISWYYDQAANIVGLVDKKQAWYDANWKNFWEGWEASIFNLKTANRFGMVVWALILNVPTQLIYAGTEQTGAPFGFGPLANGRVNFGAGNFLRTANSQTLSLEEARALLRIRYYAQTISPTVYNINYMLKDVFFENWGLAYIEETVGGVSEVGFGFGQYYNNFNAPSNFNNTATPNGAAIRAMAQKYVCEFALSENFKNALYDYLPRGGGVQTYIDSL